MLSRSAAGCLCLSPRPVTSIPLCGGRYCAAESRSAATVTQFVRMGGDTGGESVPAADADACLESPGFRVSLWCCMKEAATNDIVRMFFGEHHLIARPAVSSVLPGADNCVE